MEKWSLTQAIVAAEVVVCALILAFAGTGESGTSLLVRATAWMSGALFLLAFGARPRHRFMRSRGAGWLLRNRRYIGVSAAGAHFLHLLGILWLFGAEHPDAMADLPPPSLATLIIGGFGFVMYFAMAGTSSNAAVRKLGADNWKRLHTFGGYYIWTIYTFTYATHVLMTSAAIDTRDDYRDYLDALHFDPAATLHWAFLAAFLAVLVLRIAARFSRAGGAGRVLARDMDGPAPETT